MGTVCAIHNKLHGLSGGDRRDQVHGGVQNSRSFTGLDHALRRIGEDACQTRGLGGQHIQRHSIASNRRRIDPGDGILYRVIVDQVSRLEVIGAVQQEVHTFK